MARTQDTAEKILRPLNETVEKSLTRLPTAPKLDYNPFVQQGQNPGQGQISPQSSPQSEQH